MRYCWLILIIIIASCAENKSGNISVPSTLTFYDTLISESEKYLDNIELKLKFNKTSLAVADSILGIINIENYLEKNQFIGGKKLNQQYLFKRNVFNKSYMDCYLDTSQIHQNKLITDTLLNMLTKRLGAPDEMYSNNTLTSYTWIKLEYLIDYSLHRNGFTIEGRLKSNNELPEIYKDANVVIQFIRADNIVLHKTEQKKLMQLIDLKPSKKGDRLIIGKNYNENVLLSGTFEIEKKYLKALYLDFVYNLAQPDQIQQDALGLKEIIDEIFGKGKYFNEPGMTGYRWQYNKQLLSLEIYADGLTYAITLTDLQPL